MLDLFSAQGIEGKLVIPLANWWAVAIFWISLSRTLLRKSPMADPKNFMSLTIYKLCLTFILYRLLII